MNETFGGPRHAGGIASLAESVLNRAVALDPEAARILSPLHGARLRVVVDGAVALRIVIAIQGTRIQIDEHSDDAHAEVRGTPRRLLEMLRARDDLPSAHGVRVSGDIATLTAITRAARDLAPDWEEPIARALGDTAAGPVTAGVRALVGLATRTAIELRDATGEYLREESELLARAEELDALALDVRRVSDDAERLEKRIAALERRAPARA